MQTTSRNNVGRGFLVLAIIVREYAKQNCNMKQHWSGHDDSRYRSAIISPTHKNYIEKANSMSTLRVPPKSKFNLNMYETMGLEQQILDFESNVLKIQAMVRQEESGYVVYDYLRNLPPNTPAGRPVDEEARSIINGWCTQIMEVCQYEKETAAFAISLLDRFVASPAGYESLLDRRLYQLAALACVYSAVKIREHTPLGPTLIAQLSNGERSSEDIQKMELQVLQAVQWRVNPPTAMAFAHAHLDLIPDDELDSLSRQALEDVTQYQVDMSLLSFKFVTKKSSLVGLAALLNATESISDDKSIIAKVASLIMTCSGIQSESLSAVRIQLYELIASKERTDGLHFLPILRKPSSSPVPCFPKTSGDSFHESPRTVQLS